MYHLMHLTIAWCSDAAAAAPRYRRRNFDAGTLSPARHRRPRGTWNGRGWWAGASRQGSRQKISSLAGCRNIVACPWPATRSSPPAWREGSTAVVPARSDDPKTAQQPPPAARQKARAAGSQPHHSGKQTPAPSLRHRSSSPRVPCRRHHPHFLASPASLLI